MALPDFSMRQLLEAGVHFGHQAHRWNPKMAEYIFGTRNNIHIVDLTQIGADAAPCLAGGERYRGAGRTHPVRRHQAAGPGRHRRSRQEVGAILRQFALARRHAGQLEDGVQLDQAAAYAGRDAGLERGPGYTKKERLTLKREHDKLNRSLGGIKDMGGLPDMLFVIDTNKEDIAIKEAQRLNIPVAAIVDTNSDPKGINYLGARQRRRQPRHHAVLRSDRQSGDRRQLAGARFGHGIDVGAQAEPVVEELPPETNPLGFEPLSGPRGVADDLKKLTGVSPAIEKKLNDLGISTSRGSPPVAGRRANVGEEAGLPGRVEGWIAKAKELRAEEVCRARHCGGKPVTRSPGHRRCCGRSPADARTGRGRAQFDCGR